MDTILNNLSTLDAFMDNGEVMNDISGAIDSGKNPPIYTAYNACEWYEEDN